MICFGCLFYSRKYRIGSYTNVRNRHPSITYSLFCALPSDLENFQVFSLKCPLYGSPLACSIVYNLCIGQVVIFSSSPKARDSLQVTRKWASPYPESDIHKFDEKMVSVTPINIPRHPGRYLSTTDSTHELSGFSLPSAVVENLAVLTARAPRPTSITPHDTPRMRSETSKAKYPTPTKAETVITGPTIPQDIINEIVDHLAIRLDSHLAIDSDFLPIRACALLSKSSVQPCQRHLFRIATFTPETVDRWFKTFPVPEESPAHYVKDVRIRIGGGGGCVPEKFFKHVPRFKNVEKISLLGYGGAPLMRKTSLWRFPQSATSLTIATDLVTLIQVQDIIAQLPNLDDLWLSGSLVALDRREPLGIETVLRRRFGGKLILSGDVINMLLEIPSGLHFTEMQVSCTHRGLSLAVRLAEACGKTLEKLTRVVTLQCDLHPFLSDPWNTGADAISRCRWLQQF